MNPICYRCRSEIGKDNSSDEHLISNSIGGYVTNGLILCGPCNIKLGPLDAALGRQFNMFMVLLKVKRDRGTSRPIFATDVQSNIDNIVTPDGKSRLRHPIEIKKDGYIEIHAGTKERLRQELERQKKLNPKIDVDASMAKATFSDNEEFQQLHSFSLADMNLVLRGLAKIAVNHYIVSTGVIDDVVPAIKYVSGENPKRMAQILNRGEADEIAKPFHFVNIVGSKSERILYAYIVLFNVVRSIVLLNEDYDGPEYLFSRLFGLDGTEEPGTQTIHVTREAIDEIIRTDLPPRRQKANDSGILPAV